MDVFPGVMFEPGSLHKYLYCESGPVGRWDPSGYSTYTTLLYTAFTICIIGILSSISSVIIAGLQDWSTKTIWHGSIDWSTTVGQIFGIGFFLSHFAGSSEIEPQNSFGRYLTIISGLTIAKLPFGIGYGDYDLETP
jgi:hypothetical protein